MKTTFEVSDLIEQGLVKKKTYTEGPYVGLSVLKYSRKVFYDNLWKVDQRLLDCRGIVVDENNNIIVYPFTKVYNLNEQGTTVDKDMLVVAPQKINGFLGVASNYKGQLLVSTTGTLDSDFANMARERILEACPKFLPKEGMTYMFEICHKDDPHIIKEQQGCYLIGARENYIGSEMYLEEDLDYIAQYNGFKRPHVIRAKFSQVLELSKKVKHEGFMIREFNSQNIVCKLKSNHYLSKKFLMRLGNSKVEDMYEDPNNFKKKVDEEFFEIIDYLVEHIDMFNWLKYTDQQRRKIIEDYFKERIK